MVTCTLLGIDPTLARGVAYNPYLLSISGSPLIFSLAWSTDSYDFPQIERELFRGKYSEKGHSE